LTAPGGVDPQLLTRARGALLGLVIGNQLGVPTERLGTAAAIRNAFPQGVRDLARDAKSDAAAAALADAYLNVFHRIEPALAARDFARITALAKQYVEIVKQHRS